MVGLSPKGPLLFSHQHAFGLRSPKSALFSAEMPLQIEQANAIVEKLIDGWCSRRAIGALRILLPAWPHNGLTDGVADLADALRGVRARAKHELLDHELENLNIALSTYDRCAHHR